MPMSDTIPSSILGILSGPLQVRNTFERIIELPTHTFHLHKGDGSIATHTIECSLRFRQIAGDTPYLFNQDIKFFTKELTKLHQYMFDDTHVCQFDLSDGTLKNAERIRMVPSVSLMRIARTYQIVCAKLESERKVDNQRLVFSVLNTISVTIDSRFKYHFVF
jgi:hypothetical protein